jgi:hypothetical protein
MGQHPDVTFRLGVPPFGVPMSAGTRIRRQADRSSTRVRIAKRDGDAGETARARKTRKTPGNPKITGR